LKQVDLKTFIKKKGMTYSQVAAELGYVENHIEAVANGRIAAGRPLCVKLARWSKGKINLAPLMMVDSKKQKGSI